MQEDKIYYTYNIFKGMTEERRWFVKLFVHLDKDWESCGKGILRFIQVKDNKNMNIQQKEDLNPSINNLYALIDTIDVKDNEQQELQSAQKYQQILKTHDLDKQDIISNYNVQYAKKLMIENKIIKWRHFSEDNIDQQIALSFNDEVALYNAYEIICTFKGIQFQSPILKPSETTVDSIIEELQERLMIKNRAIENQDCYTPFYSDNQTLIKDLFELYQKAEKNQNLNLLSKIAEIIKLLIQNSTKPDIILHLVSEKNYRLFFNCLKYLKEKNSEDFISMINQFLQTKLNNVFNIQNKNILDTVQINYRMFFLKEFVLQDFLNQDQQNDLTDYLFLHDSMILRFEKLDEKIQNHTKEVNSFFHELSILLRLFAFQKIKSSFTQKFIEFELHKKVINLLLKSLCKLENEFSQKDIEIISTCLEILNLFLKENASFLIEIMQTQSRERYTLLDKIHLIVNIDDLHVLELFLDLFRAINISMQQKYTDEFVKFLNCIFLPKLKQQIDQVQWGVTKNQESQDIQDDLFQFENSLKKNQLEQSFHSASKMELSSRRSLKFSKIEISPSKIKYLCFFIEITNCIFEVKEQSVLTNLIKYNFLNTLSKTLTPNSSKLLKLYYCTYLSKIIHSQVPNFTQYFNYQKVLQVFWDNFTFNCLGKKFNMLYSASMTIFKEINTFQKGQNSELIKVFGEFILDQDFLKEEIFEQIRKKAKAWNLIDIESKVTSESESVYQSELQNKYQKVLKSEGDIYDINKALENQLLNKNQFQIPQQNSNDQFNIKDEKILKKKNLNDQIIFIQQQYCTDF